MTSSTGNNGAFMVYKRKRKCTTSEVSESFPAEVISVNSKTSESKSDIDAPASVIARDEHKKMVEFDKSGMEHHGGAAVSDAHIRSMMVQQTQEDVNQHKLLILREVLQKSMEEEPDKSNQINDEDSNKMPQLAPVYSPSGLALKEKYAKLRARQKGRLLLRNARNGPVSSSRLGGPKQGSDLHISKLKGAAAPHASPMSLKGKDIMPNASLPKVTRYGSASGFQSSTSSHKNLDSAPLRRPAGFLKHKINPNDWTELELDALWVGVRRYGQGNWERILADPGSRVFKNRTPKDLSTRWNKELLKIDPFPKPKPISSLLPPTTLVRNPQGSLNFNLQPMVAELMFQPLYPRADMKMNSMPVRMEAMQTPAISVAVKRNWLPTRPEPNFMMGGYVQFPWLRENQNGGRNHPIVIQSDSEDSNEGSETTLSG